MGAIFDNLKNAGKGVKDYLEFMNNDSPSSYRVSSELIRDRWGDKEETYHQWATRIRDHIKLRLDPYGKPLLSEYERKHMSFMCGMLFQKFTTLSLQVKIIMN